MRRVLAQWRRDMRRDKVAMADLRVRLRLDCIQIDITWQLQYIGHLARMPAERLERKMLFVRLDVDCAVTKKETLTLRQQCWRRIEGMFAANGANGKDRWAARRVAGRRSTCGGQGVAAAHRSLAQAGPGGGQGGLLEGEAQERPHRGSGHSAGGGRSHLRRQTTDCWKTRTTCGADGGQDDSGTTGRGTLQALRRHSHGADTGEARGVMWHHVRGGRGAMSGGGALPPGGSGGSSASAAGGSRGGEGGTTASPLRALQTPTLCWSRWSSSGRHRGQKRRRQWAAVRAAGRGRGGGSSGTSAGRSGTCRRVDWNDATLQAAFAQRFRKDPPLPALCTAGCQGKCVSCKRCWRCCTHGCCFGGQQYAMFCPQSAKVHIV